MKRSRTILVAFVAAVVELIIIAAACNQAVHDDVLKHDPAVTGNSLKFWDNAKLMFLTFPWRVSTGNGMTGRDLGAVYAGIGVVVVLLFVIVSIIARGNARFGQVFFGTWFAVAILTPASQVVTNALYRNPGTSVADRITLTIFRTNSYSIAFGVASGFVVALLTTLVLVASRRTVEEPRTADEPGEFAGYPGVHGDAAAGAAGVAAAPAAYAYGEHGHAEQPPAYYPSQSSGVGYGTASEDQPTTAYGAGRHDDHDPYREQARDAGEPTQAYGSAVPSGSSDDDGAGRDDTGHGAGGHDAAGLAAAGAAGAASAGGVAAATEGRHPADERGSGWTDSDEPVSPDNATRVHPRMSRDDAAPAAHAATESDAGERGAAESGAGAHGAGAHGADEHDASTAAEPPRTQELPTTEALPQGGVDDRYGEPSHAEPSHAEPSHGEPSHGEPSTDSSDDASTDPAASPSGGTHAATSDPDVESTTRIQYPPEGWQGGPYGPPPSRP